MAGVQWQAEGLLSVLLWPTSTLRARGPYLGPPMFSEEKVKEAHSDSLHSHMTRGPVCLLVCWFVFCTVTERKGRTGSPSRTRTVLNVRWLGDCAARYSLSAWCSEREITASHWLLVIVRRCLYLGWILWERAETAWWLFVWGPGAVWCVCVFLLKTEGVCVFFSSPVMDC